MVDRELTEWFEVAIGVRQGCNLLPYLFRLILESVMKPALKNCSAGVQLDEYLLNNLRFANDIDLMADNKEDLQEITTSAHNTTSKFGLKINAQKTKVMTIWKLHESINITLDIDKLEQVNILHTSVV